jgi:4-hydroxybenzoate polyprenyltransferase
MSLASSGLAVQTALSTVVFRLAMLGRAARPSQWIKNFACFAGVIFSGRLFEAHAALASMIAFGAFSLGASAVYLFNDVVDRSRDRLNPIKRHRPIASGAVPVSWALALSAFLALAACGISAALPPFCLPILALYLLINLAYSLRLKHAVLLDVGLIAIGFVLRVLMGVYAVQVQPTAWIMLCMFFLALFLGFAKRRGEKRLQANDEMSRRPVLTKYQVGYLDALLGMTATMAVLCYTLYTVTGRQGDATLVITVPLVTYGVVRYMLLVMVEGGGESPDKILVSDRLLLGTILLWTLLCVIVIYSKVQLFAA